MAKKSIIARDVKRAKLIVRYAEKRQKLKSEMQQAWADDNMELYTTLRKKFDRIPRDASRVRYQRRCQLTGRPHGVYRKFGLGRNKLREVAMKGYIPGLVKASW